MIKFCNGCGEEFPPGWVYYRTKNGARWCAKCHAPSPADDVFPDKINPSHYRKLDPEPWDAIWGWFGLTGCLASVVKYIARAGHKEGETVLDDLRKARQWLDFIIDKLAKDSECE